MASYLAQRVLLLVPTVLLASIVVFGVMRALPGDVAIVILSGSGEAPHSLEARESLREELGLNDPLAIQYGRWLWSMVNGEFGGRSLVNGEPIRTLVARQLPVTALLTLYTVAVSVGVSVPLGIIAALWRDRWPDYLIRVVTIVGQAIPPFWVALVLLLGLLVVLRWSPPIVYPHPWQDLGTHLQIMIWPVLVLTWEYSSHIARVTRASMLEVLRQDYMTTARSKGLRENVVVFRHGLRNALIPTTTILGLQLGALLSGTLILESIFGLPGIGRGVVQAALARDYPVVQSLATLLVLMMLATNLIVDLTYAALNPRISYRA